jgi:hypothetical protein
MLQRIEPEIQRKWQKLLEEAPLPEWIQEMHRHYRKTGKYRPEDLRRLLGDPNQGVEIGPHTTLASAMAQSKQGE